MEPARPAAEFRPHLFGKFFVLQRLAAGGMAEVYRAKVVGAGGFEKELALKRILAQRAQDTGFIRMLVNEAKLTAQLTHSNIAQIFECGAVDGAYFIAMELVNGVSMKEMMTSFARAGTQLTPEQAIYVVLQLLQGLDHAHRKMDLGGEPLRIVHCDVSPDNAIVSWEGEIKLLDFGIARAATGLSNYKEGMLMGKLGYVAPEQASLEKTWDHRVDLFAAGIILYELLTGRKPFPKATDVDTLIASRKTPVPAPSSLDERIPRELDAILSQALAYRPEKRYPSARAFGDALVDVLFPTPQSGIQDVLAEQMRTVFAETVQRQRAARAHDALVLKVLQHLFEQEQARRGTVPAAVPEPEPEHPQITLLADSIAAPEVHTPAARATAPRRAPPPRPVMSRRVALAGALIVAAIAAAGAWFAASSLRPGVLVVTSDPPGARVAVNGRMVEGVTPAVVDDIPSSQAVSVVVSAPDRKPVTLAVDGEALRSVRRVHADLPAAIGPLTIETEPPGAAVRFDDVPAGVTPLTVDRVRLDERHRIDLSLPGHDLDQVVVLPELDGQRVTRKLVRSAARTQTR